MAAKTSFDSLKKLLPGLLGDVADGTIQLPDFQRGWIWDDDHIRSLLASVSRSFPIGALMMLETGNPAVRFRPRPVEGLELPDVPEPELLILDGQQRLTSLFQALVLHDPVQTRDARRKPVKRWYYVDIAQALDPEADREEAIVGFPEDRKLRNFRGEVQIDCSTSDLERANGYFPLSLVFDNALLFQWQQQFISANPQQVTERLDTWTQLYQEVIERFQKYEVPVISLGKETPKEAVCLVFEKVNTGGVTLTVFELLTATYAASDYQLRDDWRERERRLKQHQVLGTMQSDDFLQAVTLLASWDRRAKATDAERRPGITCKRKDILSLSLHEYQRWAEPATRGFELAARFVRTQNIFTARDLPYRTQLTPLAAILALLGDRAQHDGVRTLLSRWYWCGVFGELYGGSIETRFARDLADVLAWIDGGPEPKTITDATFSPVRLLTLKSRNSAAYKGLFALVLRDGCLDFRSGERIDVAQFFDENVDIHHIFPKAWCEGKVDASRTESFVNKTAISARTNRTIGGNAPSVYLDKLQAGAGISEKRMDEILCSHVIEPVAMRLNEFDAFFEQRSADLLGRIENAMGKLVTRDLYDADEIAAMSEADELA
jgi:hypothetical protein